MVIEKKKSHINLMTMLRSISKYEENWHISLYLENFRNPVKNLGGGFCWKNLVHTRVRHATPPAHWACLLSCLLDLSHFGDFTFDCSRLLTIPYLWSFKTFKVSSIKYHKLVEHSFCIKLISNQNFLVFWLLFNNYWALNKQEIVKNMFDDFHIFQPFFHK